jgi:anti-sigma-K factor RskA
MKREEMDNLLVEYVLGKLDWERTEKLEEMLRSDTLLRTQLLEIQEGLESDVMESLAGVIPAPELKAKVMQNLGLEWDVAGAEASVVDRSKAGWIFAWVSWFGWAVAAVFLVIALLPVFRPVRIAPNPNTASPALAIFEIPTHINGDKRNPAVIREVVYADKSDYDSLSEAELHAEELWSRYLKKRLANGGKQESNGFVVIDLRGKQGFVGFYDVKAQDLKPQNQSQQLWLYSPERKPVSVGAIPAMGENIEGVYYFSLDGNNLSMDSFESVIPVISAGEFHGI